VWSGHPWRTFPCRRGPYLLTYLPAGHPDELLYSLLARYHRHVGSAHPKLTLEDLFGSRTIRAAVDLQPGLGPLSSRLPPSRGLTAEVLARDFTLYPYLTAFQPESIRRAVLAALTEGDAGWIHARLGLTASTVRAPSALHYCPACRVRMLTCHGELYWRRAHQLPGVLVCPDDGVPLADSRAVPNFAGQHEFLAADEDNCPAAAPEPAWSADPETVALLTDIARASAALLAEPPPAREIADWGDPYHAALAARGFGKGSHSLDQTRLVEAFAGMFGTVLDLLPGGDGLDWLAAIGRKHRKAFHPLRHLLLRLFLDTQPILAAPRPFGSGPWSCRNPLADHRGQPVITSVDTHREDGKTIGRFACSCGYVFSLAEGEDSRPRILDLGPLFETGLRRLIATGTSLRGTARALQVDPGTPGGSGCRFRGGRCALDRTGRRCSATTCAADGSPASTITRSRPAGNSGRGCQPSILGFTATTGIGWRPINRRPVPPPAPGRVSTGRRSTAPWPIACTPKPLR